jgi:hypothetical protein
MVFGDGIVSAPAYVLLGVGIGLLIGYAATDEPIPEPTPRPVVVKRIMAQEISKPDDQTCLYTRPDGRTYTLAIHEGTTCVTILGAQR